MEKLLEELIRRGFKAKIKDHKITVKLSGLCNHVFIHHNIASNTYELKTNDWLTGSAHALMLFTGLNGYQFTSHIISSMLVSVAALGFLVIILTEFKARGLRDFIDSINNQEYT